MREEREGPFHSESLYSDNQALDWHHDRSSVSPLNPSESDGRTFRKGDITINILGENRQFTHFFQAERKRERNHLIRNKGLKRKRKEFSITITLFRARQFPPRSSSLLSEDHKAAKTLDSRFSSGTSDGNLSVGGRDLLGRRGRRPSVSRSAPHSGRMSFWFHSPVITRKPRGGKRKGFSEVEKPLQIFISSSVSCYLYSANKGGRNACGR